MSAADPRAAMAGALARMLEAHTALVADVNPATLRRYVDAVGDARIAFEVVARAGFERARLARERRAT